MEAHRSWRFTKSLFGLITVLALVFLTALAGANEDLDGQLIRAAKSGDLAQVKNLLNRGARIDARSSTSDLTSLMEAAQEGHLEVVLLLLDKRANTEDGDAMSKTPLMFVSSGGKLEIVQLLLERGLM